MSETKPKSRKIMVVDDESDVRTSISLALGRRGHEVLALPDGPSAVRSLRTFTPEIVILDLMMPGMDGISTFQLLQKSLPMVVPFLFISATSLRVSEGLLKNVPHAMMHKPLDFNELVRRVELMLGGSR